MRTSSVSVCVALSVCLSSPAVSAVRPARPEPRDDHLFSPDDLEDAVCSDVQREPSGGGVEVRVPHFRSVSVRR